MGRHGKSGLRCLGATVVAGIFSLNDSLLLKLPYFRNFEKMAGFCVCRNYFCFLVASTFVEAKTGSGME